MNETPSMTPSGEAARLGRHRQSGTALRAGGGIAVRRATQTATDHVDDAERYRQPEVEPACADLGKWLRTWRHRLVCGAIRGCVAQQVGQVFGRGSPEPRTRILACRCGLTVNGQCKRLLFRAVSAWLCRAKWIEDPKNYRVWGRASLPFRSCSREWNNCEHAGPFEALGSRAAGGSAPA